MNYDFTIEKCYRFHFLTFSHKDLAQKSQFKILWECLPNEIISKYVKRCFDKLKKMKTQNNHVIPLLSFAYFQLPFKIHGSLNRYKSACDILDDGKLMEIFIDELYPNQVNEFKTEFETFLRNPNQYCLRNGSIHKN